MKEQIEPRLLTGTCCYQCARIAALEQAAASKAAGGDQ